MTTKPNEPEGLEPCPFCGGEANIERSTFSTVQARCAECVCGTGLYAGDKIGRQNAIAAWNRRAAAKPVADAGGVTTADKKLLGHIVSWVHCPAIMGVEQVERMISAHRLQSVAAATAAKDAEIARLREALTYFANRPTVAEVIEGKHDPMPDTVEARIEEMGRRKREHDEAILQARAALSEAREAGDSLAARDRV